MIWLLGVMLLLVVTAVVWAQDDKPSRVELGPIGADGTAVSFTINGGGPTCSEATLLSLPGSDSTDVSGAGASSDDPVLACMWGNPERDQGYRTIWYQFTPQYSGRVTISTLNSGYDTVLAVHSGSCASLPESLSTLACNDDTNGFSSEVSLNVAKGMTYYIEVADWHQAVNDPILNISALLNPINSKWDMLNPMSVPLSRHTAVVPGENIFVLGGQEDDVFTGAPSNRLQRYNTAIDTWDELAPMPGQTGYAHAAAVYFQGKIYVPGGVVNSYFVGSQLNQDVDDTHWVYTIGDPGSWTTAATPAWPDGSPWTWTATVASPDPQKQGYYLIGGLSSPVPLVAGAEARNEMLFYSTFSHDWHDQPAMEANGSPIPRYGHTAVWLPGKGVCVTGGIDGNAQLLSQGMCFAPTPQPGTWSTIAAMREPRYGASSAVGPDGRWYVFGGFGPTGDPIATTEVYDPQLDSWTALDVTFDLGGTQSSLARGWLQVKWANDHFWAIGGEIGSDNTPLFNVEKLYISPINLYLPFTIKPDDGSDDGYDNFAQARGLALNAPQSHNFEGLLDFVDVFYFDLPNTRQVRIRLTQVPQDSDYDIAIYSHNKLLWGKGENPIAGGDEDVTLTLPPGRYYIMVERISPITEPDPDEFYQIRVEG